MRVFCSLNSNLLTLNSNKQDKTDSSLATTAKTVVRAINEVNSNKVDIISFTDFSTEDIFTSVKNNWGTKINKNGTYYIVTAGYTHCGIVFYYSNAFGSAIFMSYNNKIHFMTLFNTSWNDRLI